jgi:RNA-directed DNA polymerase
LNYAWHYLRENGTDSPWCGQLSVDEMEPNLIRHIGDLSEQLLAGSYGPETMCYQQAKSGNGEVRSLCCSGVRDQLVQYAILTVLEPLSESFGFGLENQAHSEFALAKVRELVANGYVWLGVTNIKDCLDSLPVEAVLKSLYKLCGDKSLVAVVRLFFESQPDKSHLVGKDRGLPQGMILTPFLRELYLHQLDEFLQRKQIPFVRVADHFIVFAGDEAAARKALERADGFVKKLGLDLNPNNNQVIRSSFQYKFLGHRLPNSQAVNYGTWLRALQSWGHKKSEKKLQQVQAAVCQRLSICNRG